jgi:two-component system nitrogen regulation response regulator GlnG
MDGTVLVADDDRTIRTVLTQALTRAGCKVHATSSLVTMMRWIEEGKGDLVISDVMMPDGNGIEQLPSISAARPGLPVIIISAQNTIMTAIQATEADVFDYLPKPFDLPDLMKRASKALAIKRRAQTAPQSHDNENATHDLPLVGQTAAMQNLYRLIARVMNTTMPILLTGESGTGKSLIAKTVHDFSDRRSLPFVVATSADLQGMDGPATVLSRVKSGSLLIEEISDLDMETQGRLVRMLDALDENGPRIMASSQADLPQLLKDGLFREDLYYRVNGVTLETPALRARIDDIPLLADHFLARAARDGSAQRHLSLKGQDMMRVYSWPGNVRQLENVVKRLVFTGGADEISLTEVEMTLANQPAAEPLRAGAEGEKLSGSVAKHLRRYFDLHGAELPPPGLHDRILREVETPLIEIALDATAGNQAKCADLLGINRNTLRKKITSLDIRVTRRRKLM